VKEEKPKSGIRFRRVLRGTALGLFLVVKTLWLTVWTLYQIALGAVLVALVVGVIKVGDYFALWDIRKLRDSNPSSTAFIEAERDRLQDSLRRAGVWPPPDTLIRWSWTPLDSIPRIVRELALVAEDAKFYQHQGFDLEQIEYAMVANHQAGRKARGASTITQQVAKNLYLNKDKELSRKAREAVITLLLEHHLPKDRILEIYLNIAQFDEGVFGIRAASLHHYRKKPAALTQEEAVNLVCLLPSPARWDFRRPTSAYLQHKRLVIRNFLLYKGFRGKADSTAVDWQQGVYASLAEQLVEDRWKTLRSRPIAEGASDSGAGPDSLRNTAGSSSVTPPGRTY
jgi:monofunctional biosynthetic peptidoglycan transglycosylase